MNNVIQFPNNNVKEYRSKCVFMNRAVHIEEENGELHGYPYFIYGIRKISVSFGQK